MGEIRKKLAFQLSADILEINKIFKDNGFKLFVVGGAVRDALLGVNPKDFDLATDAVPDDVERIMNEGNFATLATGKAFGVINVFSDGNEYEIATFRIDLSAGRRPDSVSFTTIEGDVERRDLTINALFYDIEAGEVVDLVGGIEDLNKSIIRTVGSAEARFGEDRLRILRAIRFHSRFHGSTLSDDIRDALNRDSNLDGVSGERIRDEFIKGVKTGIHFNNFLRKLDEFGLLEKMFGGLNLNKNFRSTVGSVENILALLLKDNDVKIIGKRLNELKYGVDEIRKILFFISLLDLNVDNAVQIKKTQSISKVNYFEIFGFCAGQDISSRLIMAFVDFELTVTGEETMVKYGLTAGKELGDKIKELETENFKKMLL